MAGTEEEGWFGRRNEIFHMVKYKTVEKSEQK